MDVRTMKNYIFSAIFLLTSGSFFLEAQTTKEELKADILKTGGVYYAYPTKVNQNTPAPEGYKPFYVSHYGRHGSRYLISDNDYKWILELLEKARKENALTVRGDSILNDLKQVWIEAEGRGGDLSPLGVKQHKGIASRLAHTYPEVFTDDAVITARSTPVVRCVLSMDAFCESLKEYNPKLEMSRDASHCYLDYLNYHSPQSNEFTGEKGAWRTEYSMFEREMTHPDRLVSSIFTSPEFIKKYVEPDRFMWGLYWIAVDMQNIETPVTFTQYFTPDELIDLWQVVNYHNYVIDSSYPGSYGLVVGNARNLLQNILEGAQEAVKTGKRGATLRFGHDGNIIPLTAILKLDSCYPSEWNPKDCYKVFSNFKVAPMASNVQIILFRNENDPHASPLVKFLLNEEEVAVPLQTDIFPYYKWEDVRNLWTKTLEEYKIEKLKTDK